MLNDVRSGTNIAGWGNSQVINLAFDFYDVMAMLSNTLRATMEAIAHFLDVKQE